MIQWFPGHMAKTRKLITENLRLVDVVVEMVDARLPMSSRNPLIDDLIGAKPRLIIMAKEDLAESEMTKAWIRNFEAAGWPAIAGNFRTSNPKLLIKQLTAGIEKQAEQVLERRRSRGIMNTSIRVMITGIPNVGKSTLINLFAGKARAETGDKPGVTRGKQWIRLEKDLELLDMPGILWPKIEDPDTARKLAVTGAIGDNAYDPLDLSLWLIQWLRTHRPGRLAQRYGISETITADEIGREAVLVREDLPEQQEAFVLLETIARRRGFLRKGGNVETDKAAIMLLDELRAGKLGPVTWDDPETFTAPAQSVQGLMDETGVAAHEEQ